MIGRIGLAVALAHQVSTTNHESTTWLPCSLAEGIATPLDQVLTIPRRPTTLQQLFHKEFVRGESIGVGYGEVEAQAVT